ncbi:MAG: peptidylprolyl isomerase [Candidatus Endobugula sp.]|jgi:peptidylprolyl isomerase
MFSQLKKLVLVCTLLNVSSLVTAENLALTITSSQGQEKGVVIIQLDTAAAPNHAARIKVLTEKGLYNGVAFHRVIPGFMAQTGDVEFGNRKNFNEGLVGSGSSDEDDLTAEFSDTSFNTGVVGMARSRYIHSANSQFFIMTKSQAGLDGQYTVVGKVIAGMGVVNNIKQGSTTENGKVTNPDYIKEAAILP